MKPMNEELKAKIEARVNRLKEAGIPCENGYFKVWTNSILPSDIISLTDDGFEQRLSLLVALKYANDYATLTASKPEVAVNYTRFIITHILNCDYYQAVFLLRKMGYDEPFFRILERWGIVDSLISMKYIERTKEGIKAQSKEMNTKKTGAIDLLHAFMVEERFVTPLQLNNEDNL